MRTPRLTAIFTACKAQFDDWRGEAWPLKPLGEMPTAYRISIVTTILAEIAILAGLVASGLFTLGSVDPLVLLSGAVVAIGISTRAFRESDNTADDHILGIPIALALSGHHVEALFVSAIGILLPLLRRPLVPHLVIANLANWFCIVASSSALVTWIVPASPEPAALIGTGIAAVLIVLLLVESATWVSAILGGYVTRQSALRTLFRGLRTRAIAVVPISVIVGFLIALDGHWMLATLILPWIAGYSNAALTDELVDARDDAQHDPLTGLLNRRALYEVLAACTQKNFVVDSTRWVLVCDLDNFKQINDHHGHDAGDHALLNAADAIRTAVTCDAVCARYGGDEFVVVATAANHTEIALLGQEICHGIADKLGFFEVTVSVGIHLIREADDARTAINHADGAMYLSKERGANRVTFSTEATNEQQASEPESIIGDDSPVVLSTSDASQSRTYWESMVAHCRVNNDAYGEARALYQLYWVCSDTDSQKYLTAARETGAENYAWAARAAAAIAARSNELDGAIEHDRRALHLARIAGDRVLETVALMSLGRSQMILGDLESAIGLLQRAVRIATVQRNYQLVLRGYERLVDALMTNLQTDDAVDAARLCLDIIERNGAHAARPEAEALNARALLCSGSIQQATALVTQTWQEVTSQTSMMGNISQQFVGHAQNAGAVGVLTIQQIEVLASAADAGYDRLGINDSRIAWIEIRWALGHEYRIQAAMDQLGVEKSRLSPDRHLEYAEYALWLARIAALDGQLDAAKAALEFVESLTDKHISPLLTETLREIKATCHAMETNDTTPLAAASRQWNRFGRTLDSLRCQITLAAMTLASAPSITNDAIIDLHSELLSIGLASDAADVYALLTTHTDVGAVDLRELLSKSKVIGGLQLAEQEAVIASVVPERVVSGTTIFSATSSPESMWLIISGTVALSRSTPDGKKLTVALLDSGDVLGDGGIVDNRTSGVFAQTIDDCLLARIPIVRMRELMDAIPALQSNLLNCVASQLQRTQEFAEQVALWSVRERIATLLIDLDQRYGHPTMSGSRIINKHITQSQLADMVGAVRVTFANAFTELRKQGIVSMRGRCIVIDDMEALTQLLPGSSQAPKAA